MINRVRIVAIREHFCIKEAEGKHPYKCRVVESTVADPDRRMALIEACGGKPVRVE